MATSLLEQVLQARGGVNDPVAQFRSGQVLQQQRQAQNMLQQMPPVSQGIGIPSMPNPGGPRPPMGQQYVQAVPPMQTYDPQAMAKRVLEMSVKRIPADLSYDSNGDGRITAADALAVAKGWQRPGDQMMVPPMGVPPAQTYDPQAMAKRVLEMSVKRIPVDLSYDTNNDGRITAADALAVAKGWQRPGDQMMVPPMGVPVPGGPMPGGTTMPSPGTGGIAGLMAAQQQQQPSPFAPQQPSPVGLPQVPMTKEQQLLLQNLSTPATLQNLSADMRFIGGPTTSQQQQLALDVAMAAAQQQAMGAMQQPMGALPVRQFMPPVATTRPSQSAINQVYDQARASGRNVFDYSVLNKPASPPPMTGPFPPSMRPQQNSPVPMQPYLNSQVNRGPQQPSPFAPQQPSMGSQFSQRPQQPSPFAPQQPSMGPQPPNQAAGQRAKLF